MPDVLYYVGYPVSSRVALGISLFHLPFLTKTRLYYVPYTPQEEASTQRKLADADEFVLDEMSAQRKLADAEDYTFYPGAESAACPVGQEVPQQDCLAAANALTPGLTTITNRNDLLINDWGGLPCGCFIWSNQLIDYDPNCANAGPHPSAELVCRHPGTITGSPTTAPTPWSPPPPVAFPAVSEFA